MLPFKIELNWPETPAVITFTIVLAVFGRWVLLRAIQRASNLAVARAERRRQASGTPAAAEHQARDAARAATVGSLLRSLTNAVVSVLALLTILATIGVPLAPVLASAGVGGIAIGFGAQSLVKDYLAGIFMIVEDQYGVGDVVDLGEASGVVEDVGLRVTRIRDSDGQVWYLRNGEIARVGNQSQGWSTATVDIPIDSREDAAEVIKLLDQVATDVHDDPTWAPRLLAAPKVVGVESIGPGQITIRIVARTKPDEHEEVQRAILDRAVAVLSAAGVRGPRVLPSAPPQPPPPKPKPAPSA